MTVGSVHGFSREEFLAGAGLPSNQDRCIRRCHVVHLLQDMAKRAATADDATEAQGAVDLLFQVRIVRFQLLPEPVEFRERARICHRRRRLVRKHPQPAELLLVDECPAEHAEYTKCVATKDEWVTGKALDGFLLNPLGVGPLAARGNVKQLSGAFGGNCPHRRRAELHARIAEWDSPEGAVDP